MRSRISDRREAVLREACRGRDRAIDRLGGRVLQVHHPSGERAGFLEGQAHWDAGDPLCEQYSRIQRLHCGVGGPTLTSRATQ